MFGVSDDHTPVWIHQHCIWPLIIGSIGAGISLLAIIIIWGNQFWIVPTVVGPCLILMAAVGVFLPGVTGVLTTDWSPYKRWQLALGAAWFTLTVVLPTMTLLAVTAVTSLWAWAF